MRTLRNTSLICLAILLGMIPCLAGDSEQAKPQAEQPNWQKTYGFSKPEIVQLTTHKVLITSSNLEQIFEAYTRPTLPVFITSDSLLNAYHVLYEESICRMEIANARCLPEILKAVWDNLGEVEKKIECDIRLEAAALKRARIVLGTALALLGDESVKSDKAVAAHIAAEVKRIRAGAGMTLPEWWGKADATFAGFDYSRFRPRSFYDRNEILRNYFMAVSWLQAVPFRMSKDVELVAILMLGKCLDSMEDYDYRDKCKAFFRCYSDFVGTGDDWDILTAKDVSRNSFDLHKGGLKSVRAELARKIKEEGGPKINDQLRFPPTDPNAEASEPNFRVISAYRTPDSILFHRTTNGLGRNMPEGLEICALLGSSYARSQLGPKKLLEMIDANKYLLEGEGLYKQYLRALTALLDKPEPDAPKFMGREAWQVKSCNTVLAGWAQMRHTWALQAKHSIKYIGVHMTYTGFVEPEPEFFAAMRKLVAETSVKLGEAGAYTVFEQEVAHKCSVLAALIRKYELAKYDIKAIEKMTKKERTQFWIYMNDLAPIFKANPLDDEEHKQSYAGLEKMLDRISKIIRQGKLDKYPKLRKALNEESQEIKPLWTRLQDICTRLEVLARKQLRGVAFDKAENQFMKDYGEKIARIMLYNNDYYTTPRDNASRIIDVHSDPNTGTVLEVGIGRPWLIYVLYPHNGKDILCRGAIMPYYEFTSKSRLTDGEWRNRLDSEDCPKPPEWLKPAITK